MNAYEALAAYKRGEKINPNELQTDTTDLDGMSASDHDMWMRMLKGEKPKVKKTANSTIKSMVLHETD